MALPKNTCHQIVSNCIYQVGLYSRWQAWENDPSQWWKGPFTGWATAGQLLAGWEKEHLDGFANWFSNSCVSLSFWWRGQSQRRKRYCFWERKNRQTQKTIPLTPVNRDMKSQRWVWFGLEGWSNGELGRGWYRSWGKIKPHQRTKVRLSIGWTCGGGRQLKRGILFRQQPIGLSPRSFGKSLTSSFDRYNTCHALMWKKVNFLKTFRIFIICYGFPYI